LFLLGSLAFAGGCALMPDNGPPSLWPGQRSQGSLPFSLVKVTPEVVDVLARAVPRLATDFKNKRPPMGFRFGVGDILSVSIFEASAGGLFIPSEAGVRPGNFITIPSQAVDANGNISIPYAGAIRAIGRTQVQVQQAIVDALKNRAIEPQAVVSVIDQRTSVITVLGDTVGVLPARAAGERILDVIARAGGTKNPGYDEWVMLERGGKRSLSPFGALIYEPTNNIYANPGDTIYVYADPQSFLAFGATGAQSQILFNTWRLSLAEAIGKAGGLNDNTADPASVFLYRGETREVATLLGIDVSNFEGPIIPVIYNMDLRDHSGYFLATKFEMRNKDVIYVSNAVSVEVNKYLSQFVSLLSSINTTVNDPISTALQVYALKSAIKGTAVTVLGGSSPAAATAAPAPAH
jgi:polysaccharide export outer membrane protein